MHVDNRPVKNGGGNGNDGMDGSAARVADCGTFGDRSGGGSADATAWGWRARIWRASSSHGAGDGALGRSRALLEQSGDRREAQTHRRTAQVNGRNLPSAPRDAGGPA